MKIAINEKYGGLEVIKIIDSDIPKLNSNEVLVK